MYVRAVRGDPSRGTLARLAGIRIAAREIAPGLLAGPDVSSLQLEYDLTAMPAELRFLMQRHRLEAAVRTRRRTTCRQTARPGGFFMEAIAWPAAVVITALVFFWLFREQIGGLIARTKKVSRGGIEADAQSQAIGAAAASSAAEKLLRESDTVLITEQEELFAQQLDKLGFESAEDRARYLLRQLTVCTILRTFEFTYFLIFGSQIIALQQLNGRDDMTLDDLKPMHDFAAAAYPAVYERFSFEAWFGFLGHSSLVLRDGEDVRITVRGREFLRYLIAAGLGSRKTG